MSERYTNEMFLEHRRKQDEKARREQAAFQERVAKQEARKTWAGDDRSFEAAWPRLRDEMHKKRVMDADQRAREAQRERTRSAL